MFLIRADLLLKFEMDARVQDVTEGTVHVTVIFRSDVELLYSKAVNVLRMIKLFGWERRISEGIKAKRNDELGWLWKLKVGIKLSSTPLSSKSSARC